MNSNPYFSIVMPVKNRADLVGEAITSIIKQTYENWELIVVDDHSTDATAEVVRSFADPRIKLFSMPEGKTGISAARDFAIQQSHGRVIVIADSDDYNYPYRLQITHDYFASHSDCDVFYGNIVRFYPEECREETRWFQPFVTQLMKHINFIPNPTAAFTRAAYDSVDGYDPQFVYAAEDQDLWLQFIEASKQFGYTEKPLVRYRKHAGGSSSALERVKHYQELLRKKHHLQLSLDVVKRLAKPEVYAFYKDRI